MKGEIAFLSSEHEYNLWFCRRSSIWQSTSLVMRMLEVRFLSPAFITSGSIKPLKSDFWAGSRVGQRGQTVNLLRLRFGGSNPPLPMSFFES